MVYINYITLDDAKTRGKNTTVYSFLIKHYDIMKYFMGNEGKIDSFLLPFVIIKDQTQFGWPPALCVPKPTRAPSAYLIFSQEYRQTNPQKKMNMAEISAEWKNTSDRTKYESAAGVLRQQYVKELKSWNDGKEAEKTKRENAANSWASLPPPASQTFPKGTKVRFKDGNIDTVRMVIENYPGLWHFNSQQNITSEWLRRLFNEEYLTIDDQKRYLIGGKRYVYYFLKQTGPGGPNTTGLKIPPELLEIYTPNTGGGPFAWVVTARVGGLTSIDGHGLCKIKVDNTNKTTEYHMVSFGGERVKWTLDWTTHNIFIETDKRIYTIKNGIDELKKIPANAAFYAQYPDIFLPTVVHHRNHWFIMSYATSDTDIAPKTVSNIHWQYDGNYTHGAAEWVDMERDQWKEMTLAYLAYKSGGSHTLSLTVSATHGNHPSPQKYEYNFGPDNVNRPCSPPFSGMVQLNTSSGFHRPIRMVDNSVAVSYVPKFVRDSGAVNANAAAAAAAALVQKRNSEELKTIAARPEYHAKFPGWPIATLNGAPRPFSLGVFNGAGWLGRSYHQVEELTGKLPDALTSHYDQDLVQQLFGWRELPELNSNKTFVDYFRLASQFSTFMDTVQLLKSGGVDVKCSILFHATDMSVIDKIIVGGFQNIGATHGAVCGIGAYNALFPYVDYTISDNNRSGVTYINWNKGFGAVIVSIGVVIPSEYTYGTHGAQKSGSGTNGTSNNQGVCGGSFLSTNVQDDGTIHKNNREIVHWFDKLKYLCPLGIAIFKEG